MKTQLEAGGGDNSTSTSSSLSYGGQMEKQNSITSIESRASNGTVEDEGNVVIPHMGLLSSCNMVNISLFFIQNNGKALMDFTFA